MMIEGFGDFLSVDEMLYAIEKGHEAVARACGEIEAWAAEVGRPKASEKMLVVPEGVDEAVKNAVGPELAEAMAIGVKQQRGAAVEKIRNKAMEMLPDFQVRRLTLGRCEVFEGEEGREGRRHERTPRHAVLAEIFSFYHIVPFFFSFFFLVFQPRNITHSMPSIDLRSSTNTSFALFRRASVTSHSWG